MIYVSPAPASLPFASAISGVAAPIALGAQIGNAAAQLGNYHASENYMASYQNSLTSNIKKVMDDLNAKEQAGTATLTDYREAHDQISYMMNDFQQFARTTGGKAAQQGVQTVVPWVAQVMGNLEKTITDRGGTVSMSNANLPGGNPTISNPSTVTSGNINATQPTTLQTILRAGIPIGTSILGSVLGSSQTSAEKAALAQLMQNNQLSTAAGVDFLNRAQPPLDQAQGFWQSILNGGPSATRALGPQIAQTGQTYDTALKSLRETAPRSGNTSMMAAELPFEKAKATTGLYQNLFSTAPTQLSTLGTNMANLGFSGLSGGRSGNNTLLDYESGRRTSAMNYGNALGNTLAKILFAPKGSGSSTSIWGG